MDLCGTCSIKTKVYECCGSHPESGEQAKLVLNSGRTVWACPELGADGSCLNYDSRPEVCDEHVCHKFYSLGLDRVMGFR